MEYICMQNCERVLKSQSFKVFTQSTASALDIFFIRKTIYIHATNINVKFYIRTSRFKESINKS